MTTLTEARQSIPLESLQEVMDAEDGAASAALTGLQQFCTPLWFRDQCMAGLPFQKPASAIDPQVGAGALIHFTNSWGTATYGIDLDNRVEGTGVPCNLITGHCVKVWDTLDELYPGTHFQCANANPPFSKKWKDKNGQMVDSTLYTWRWVTTHANYGFFIANADTIERLELNKSPLVYRYQRFENVFPNVRLIAGVLWWKLPVPKPITTAYGHDSLTERWNAVKKIVDEEKSMRPNFNIYLDRTGILKTYLSVRSTVKLKLTPDTIRKLHSINDCHPLTLTVEKETRNVLAELVNAGIYKVEPAAEAAIKQALADVAKLACPIMPVTPFETVAYADEEEALECTANITNERMRFTAGKRYPLQTATYQFKQNFTRTKVHYDEQNMRTYTADHECQLTGQDRLIRIKDDLGHFKEFMDRPDPNLLFQFDESMLWNLFKKPDVKTVAEAATEVINTNLAVLRGCEMIAGYKYYPGQSRYLSRVACKDSGLVAAETGTGKTLMAISLLSMKAPERCLIVAPQGTMRSTESEDEEDAEDYNASQWITELGKFAPYLQVWELFSYSDYERILALNNGQLPPGVYVSYYQAMFSNGGRETAASSWDDVKLNKILTAIPETRRPVVGLEENEFDKCYWTRTIGREENGIRCIIQPCLATMIGHHFDMIMLDEAHVCTNLETNITQMLIRLQPRYRWALTATPIPNIISNLFSLMGWLSVPGWYKGGIRNAAWPYAREEIGRFNTTFLSMERDFTQETMNQQRDPKWKGKCVKSSPVISAPARLLKMIKPTMAFISKADCNPKYVEPKVHDIRVPLGQQQAKLYAWYLERGNVPASNALVRARKQSAWLRYICADPAGFRHARGNAPKVQSNMNPKVIAILELARDILGQGKPLIIINSRVGLTDTIQAKLIDAGVPIARIDSTIPAEQHAQQAGLFKTGRASVLLMGIRCAASYSFDHCEHLIIGSLEYSPGPFTQAKGRIDRLTSEFIKHIYCILHKHSMEELMFDTVATKDDAATICLRGQRVPRAFKPVDPSEVLANSINRFDMTGTTPEVDCEAQWPRLRDAISANLKNNLTPTHQLR
jgi:superfamily II DNA or RNA helicase